MEGIVSDLYEYNRTIESRIKAAGFKARVMQVFAAWTEWAVYPKDFLALLKHIFLGGQTSLVAPQSVVNEKAEDIDGAPLSGDEKDDEDLDGIPLDGAALLKSALARRDFAQGPVVHSPSTRKAKVVDEDIDGIPLAAGGDEDYDDDIDGVPLESSSRKESKPSGFIPSKWETIAPDQVEAQAITTSKWDTLEKRGESSRKRSYDSDDSQEEEEDDRRRQSQYDEEKRSKLREVEVQMLEYQDELESGARSLREGESMSSQLEQQRQRLMRKSLAELRESRRRSSGSPDE